MLLARSVGDIDGCKDGFEEGIKDGNNDGFNEGSPEGVKELTTEGVPDRTIEGCDVATREGERDGLNDGNDVGYTVGIIDGTNDGFPDGTNDTCIPPPHMQQASDIDLPLGSLGFIEKQYIAWISEGTPSKSAQLEPASEIQFGSLIHSDGATLGTFDGLSLILGMYDGTVEGDKLGSVDGIELGVVDGLLEVDGATECSKLGNAEVVGLLEGIEDGIFDVKAEPPHIQQA